MLSAMSRPAIAATTSTKTKRVSVALFTTDVRAGHATLLHSPRASRNHLISENRVGRCGHRGSSGGGRSPPIGGAGGNGGPGGTRSLAVNGSTSSSYNSEANAEGAIRTCSFYHALNAPPRRVRPSRDVAGERLGYCRPVECRRRGRIDQRERGTWHRVAVSAELDAALLADEVARVPEGLLAVAE